MTEVAEKFELHTEPPPNEIAMYQEDGQYLRVTLDKAQNYLDAAGHRLNEMFKTKFGRNKEALRVWYRENVEVWEGTFYEHRAWEKVEKYLDHLEADRKYQAGKRNRVKADLDELDDWRSGRRRPNEENQGVMDAAQLYNQADTRGSSFDPTVDHELEDWVATYNTWPKTKQRMAAARIGLGPIAQV